MDDDQVLDEGKNTQSEESLSREETRDGDQQPYNMYISYHK